MHGRRAPERRVDVSARNTNLPRQVAGSLVHLGRARLQRFLGVEDGGELLVLDPDELDGVHRRGLVDGRHRRDLLAREPDLAGGEDTVLLLDRPPQSDRSVRPGHHGPHTGYALGGLHVHVDDARVRVRAAEDLGVQHVRHLDVADVLRGAEHLLARRQVWNARTDHRLFHGRPLISPACARTV